VHLLCVLSLGTLRLVVSRNPPRTRFAVSGGLNIAYQVVGEGQSDLVWVPGYISHLDASWSDPELARLFERLASLRRLIMFDKRGTGMSDRVFPSEFPSFAERMDDIRAVMDAAGSERAAIVGWSEGAALAALFAATYPDRVEQLVLYGGYPRLVNDAGYQDGIAPELVREVMGVVVQNWAEVHDAHMVWAPSKADDEEFQERFARFRTLAASPGAAQALVNMTQDVDVRSVLPTVSAPTLVIHRTGDLAVPITAGRYLAKHIPEATLVELDGTDHLWWVGNHEAIVDAIEEFLTGSAPDRAAERVLSTVLFTDICGSTERAVKLGDRRWRDLLSRHDAVFRAELDRQRGREVKATGDGFLSTFDVPARAIRCAEAAATALLREGLEIRAGLHTGECELRGGDVAGIAVHIAARIASHAKGGEVLVSRTVTDLVAGSGIRFEDRGSHELKGVPEPWHLYAVSR
jgi:class 3 adenylate cyclase